MSLEERVAALEVEVKRLSLLLEAIAEADEPDEETLDPVADQSMRYMATLREREINRRKPRTEAVR